MFELPDRLKAEVIVAFGADRWPGPWRGVGVEAHTHPPPFCWGRSTKDCTLRVVQLMDAGISLTQIAATSGGMSRQALTVRLRERGIRTTRLRSVTPNQRLMFQRLRDTGMTLTDIAALVMGLSGRRYSINTVARNTVAAKVARVTASFTMTTQCVDAIHRLAARTGLTPGKALETLMIEMELQQGEDDEDDEAKKGAPPNRD